MKVTIELIGVFRIGRFESAVRDYPPATSAGEIIAELHIPADLFGVVLINGIHSTPDRVLNDGDRITILPYVSGG
jgi:molybdopterin converting factor small subunit